MGKKVDMCPAHRWAETAEQKGCRHLVHGGGGGGGAAGKWELWALYFFAAARGLFGFQLCAQGPQ